MGEAVTVGTMWPAETVIIAASTEQAVGTLREETTIIHDDEVAPLVVLIETALAYEWPLAKLLLQNRTPASERAFGILHAQNLATVSDLLEYATNPYELRGFSKACGDEVNARLVGLLGPVIMVPITLPKE